MGNRETIGSGQNFKIRGWSRSYSAAKLIVLLAVACMINGTPAGCQKSLMTIPTPNWNDPPADAAKEAAAADARPLQTPTAQQISFTFTLAEPSRSTSAAVYDAERRLVRTLWSARPYAAGKHHDLWDGNDDYGKPVPAGRYTVKVLAGNVHYDWDGEIGVTEGSVTGPNNWDGSGSFPSSFAFLNGKAYVAGGYNEARLEAFVFDEKNPYTVAPLNLALQSGGQFEFASTDGVRIYFASLMAFRDTDDAVVAFTPDGQPYSFPQGTVMRPPLTRPAYFSNVQMRPPLKLPGVRGIDVASNLKATITGLAVERSGSLLATAHGARGANYPSRDPDNISLWDKNTGTSVGTIHGVQNPHKMVFDLDGNLWAIEGGPVAGWFWDSGAKLAKVSDVGGGNVVTEPIAGLENPVDVAINPVNGHLFVADGGISQQVKEFDPKTGQQLSAVGTPGGFGQGDACNANLTPTSFWLDLNMKATGVSRPWIAVDDGGNLWVGDFASNRILEFNQGKYLRQIEMGRWQYEVAVPDSDPSRVFGGINGMLEYQVDYSKPLLPGDPTATGGNGAWRAVRNWFPCFLQAERGQQDGKEAILPTVQTLANGITYGMIAYHGGPFTGKTALVELPVSGKIKVVNNRLLPYRELESDGSYYTAPRSGTFDAPIYTVKHFAITGYDAQGFPNWDQGTQVATLTADLSKGTPQPACYGDGCDMAPTTGGIIPLYIGHFPKPSATTFDQALPAFHLGGLPVSGSALQWQAMPEKPLLYPDGRGAYSSLIQQSNTANGVHALHHDIFAGYNGNWQSFSCQFFHYRDDGLFVGQFGWRGSAAYPFIGTGGGYPDPRLGQPLAPGYCGNNIMFKVVQVGKDYYLYTADEGYRAGLHRWHIWNLESIKEYMATAALGETIDLKALQ